MRRQLKEKLLREYVRQSLMVEDGTYFASAEGPYGVSFGSQEDLYNTFIGPFADVFKTAVGKTKEVTRRAGTLIRVGFETIITTLLPFMGSDYSKIFEREKSDLQKIKSEYKEVYDRTDAALKSNDAAFLAFMAFPQYVMGGYAAKQGFAAASSILSALSGGYFDNLFEKTKKGLEDAGKWTDRKVSQVTTAASKDFKIRKESYDRQRLIEAEGSDNEKYDSEKLLSNKKFLNAVLGSRSAREAQTNARELYRRTLSEVIKEAEKVLKNTKNVEDVKKALAGKKQIPEIDKISALPAYERQAAEKKLIDGIRKSMKEFYIKNLKDHISTVVKAGIPEESPYIKDYKTTMQKIQSM